MPCIHATTLTSTDFHSFEKICSTKKHDRRYVVDVMSPRTARFQASTASTLLSDMKTIENLSNIWFLGNTWWQGPLLHAAKPGWLALNSHLVNENSRRYWDESAFALPHNAHILIDQGALNGTNNFSMWCESMWIPDPGWWCTESCHSSASIVGFLDLRCSKSLHGSESRLADSQSCFMIGKMFEHSWVAGFWE